MNRIVEEKGDSGLANILIGMRHVWHHCIDQTLSVEQGNVLGRLVFEEVAETTYSQHNESLGVLWVTYKPQHSLNVLGTSVTRCICLVGSWMKKINPV